MTKVIFRKWNNGQIIALFPGEAADACEDHCSSFDKQCGHSAACCDSIILLSRPPSSDEYAELREALVRLGYSLKIARRTSASDRLARRAQIKNMKG